MAFGIPAPLDNAIQQGFLAREFIDPLKNILAYRKIADREVFPGRIGDSITKTRMGLMVPNTTPLNPSTNTNLDNGMTPQQYTDEQYVLSILQYPQLAPDINLVDDEITISSFAMRNSFNLGVAQATAVDRIARQALFNAYMGGNTTITATLGAPALTVNVDDTRGFQTVVVSTGTTGGVVTPVSALNPLSIFINNVPYSVVGFTNDVINISSAISTGGISGTIILSANVAVVDGTAGNPVVSAFAPLIVRPNARQTTSALLGSDLLNMNSILNAIAYLRNNAVPKVNGAYNMFLNSSSMNQLYADPEFQLLTRGVSTRDPDYENAWINSTFLDVRFVMTTETYVQAPVFGAPVPVAQTIQRPIICGQGALVEGIFNQGLDAVKNMSGRDGMGVMQQFPGVIDVMGDNYVFDGFYQYLRPPLDRLGQILSQSSNYIGGFTVPTDTTTLSAIIPTASNAYYKRCVILETA